MHPKITIVTPSFNQAKYLEETILSVISQNYPNLEYIIIDGGSTDESVEIIKKYQKHLTHWVSEPDRGDTHAINKGLRVCNGDIINWLNSDDLLLPGALFKVAEAFEQNKDAMFVFGDAHQIAEDGRLIYVSKVVPFDRNVLFYGRILGVQPSVFFHRKVIEGENFLDERYTFCMDIEFWIRGALRGYKFTPIYEALSANRFHRGTKTVRLQDILMEEHINILKELGVRLIRLPNPWRTFVYGVLRNTFRYKCAFKRLVNRRDFGINRSKKARELVLKEEPVP